MIFDRAGKVYSEKDRCGSIFLRILRSGGKMSRRPSFFGPSIADLAMDVLEAGFGEKKLEQLMADSGIDGELFEGYPYSSFRAFFRRRYKRSSLPINDPREIISPCDGLVTTHVITEDLKLHIQGRRYSLKELMGGCETAELFRGGRLFLIRQSLLDCHGFIYTENGSFSGQPVHRIHGGINIEMGLHYGNRRERDRFRCWSLLETRRGMVMTMETGSSMAGSIQYRRISQPKRGEERGWFEIGSGILILLYQKGTVQPDLDIIQETEAGNSVRVRLGERIGTRVAVSKRISSSQLVG